MSTPLAVTLLFVALIIWTLMAADIWRMY